MVLRKVLPHDATNPVTQHKRLLHPRATEVQVTVLEPQVLAGQILLCRKKRGRLTAIKNLKLRGADLNRSRGQFRIHGTDRSRRHGPGHLQHVLAFEPASHLPQIGPTVRIEDDLRLPVAIAEIDEDGPSVIATGIDPPTESDRNSFLIQIQFTACMASEHRGSFRYDRVVWLAFYDPGSF